MEEKKGKINLLLFILLIIVLILVAVIVILYMKKENVNNDVISNNIDTFKEYNSNEKLYASQLEEKDKKIAELENELVSLNNNEKTDLNIIEETLLKKLQTAEETSIDINKNIGYKVEDIYINKIEIYNAEYLDKIKEYPSDQIKFILESGDLVGETTFTLTFNKSLDGASFEGSGGYALDNKLIESKFFILKKDGDNYKVELCTGF